MPTAAVVMRDKRVGGLFDLCILAVQAFWKDAYVTAGGIAREGMGRRVKSVLRRKEHRARAEHDSWVIHDVRMVKGDKVPNSLLHEGMTLGRKHEVV